MIDPEQADDPAPDEIEEADEDDAVDVPALCRTILQVLQTTPEAYKRFGIWWWFMKAMLKRAGYGPQQLYMLGSYQDAETAAMIPQADLEGTIRAAMAEYKFNTVYPRSDGMVENETGELVAIVDDDASF